MLDLVLERLVANTTHPDWELVVVADGSTDDSAAILRRWRDSGRLPAVTLVEQPAAGAMAALNTALGRARGELVQLDGDANGMHDRGTASPSRAAADAHSRVHRPRAERCPEAHEVADVDATVGCCMLYPRGLAEEIGGYDVGFSPVWFDDLDLSLSARRLGRKVLSGARRARAAPREPAQPRDTGRELGALRRVVGRLTPQAAKDVLIATARLDRPTPAQLERLHHHYGYWRDKWGWDPLNPDLDAIIQRWGATEVCWRWG